MSSAKTFTRLLVTSENILPVADPDLELRGGGGEGGGGGGGFVLLTLSTFLPSVTFSFFFNPK